MVEARVSGPWRRFGVPLTAAQAIPHYQALVDAGIQYLIVGSLDASGTETMRLFAKQVAPTLKQK